MTSDKCSQVMSPESLSVGGEDYKVENKKIWGCRFRKKGAYQTSVLIEPSCIMGNVSTRY